MNFMEKLAASHMTEEGFAAWSGEEEKQAGKVSSFLSAIRSKGGAAASKVKEKAKSLTERVGAIGGTKVPKSQMGKGMLARVSKDRLAKGKKRLAIAGGVAGAGAVGTGAYMAMKGKKKGYKERM